MSSVLQDELKQHQTSTGLATAALITSSLLNKREVSEEELASLSAVCERHIATHTAEQCLFSTLAFEGCVEQGLLAGTSLAEVGLPSKAVLFIRYKCCGVGPTSTNRQTHQCTLPYEVVEILKLLSRVSDEPDDNEVEILQKSAKAYLREIQKIGRWQSSIDATTYAIAPPGEKQENLPSYQEADLKLPNLQFVTINLSSGNDHPEMNRMYIIVEQPKCFTKDYKLASKLLLGEHNLLNTSNILFNTHNAKSTNLKNYVRQTTKLFAEQKKNLQQLKEFLQFKEKIKLSSVDNAYIERKYIKYCMELCLHEMLDFIKIKVDSGSVSTLQQIFALLDKANDLNQLPEPLNQLEYYKLLMKHQILLRNKEQAALINQLRTEGFQQIAQNSNNAKQEVIFVKSLVNLLGSYKDCQMIIADLDLANFCEGKSTFVEVLKRVLKLKESDHGKQLVTLQKVSRFLLQEEHLLLMDKVTETISEYIKPVKIEERHCDGRLVLEVLGQNVALSAVLHNLEKILLDRKEIEEVRIIGGSVVHVDTNLQNGVWQGRNIVVMTKMLRVYDRVTWDVSGKDNSNSYSSDAGTGSDGHGIKGKDGFAGESGGNIVILVHQVENEENFTLVSKGGKGSKGQDGGNGKNGSDGKGISYAEFRQLFPTTEKTAFSPENRRAFRSKTIEILKKCARTIENEWYEESDTNKAVDSFVKVVSEHGNRITFSFKKPVYQTFIVYEGAVGEKGGNGGEPGLGGQGGRGGEILVEKLLGLRESGIHVEVGPGQDGADGLGGLHGTQGKQAWDLAFTDYQFWSEPVYYGKDQNSKLTLDYYNSSGDQRIWCPYFDKYADITARRLEHTKQVSYSRACTSQDQRQSHARAVGKKNISRESIMTAYSVHMEATLQNLESQLEVANKHALNAVLQNAVTNEKLSLEANIQRVACYEPWSHKPTQSQSSVVTTTPDQTVHIPPVSHDILDNLQTEPHDLDQWFQLNTIPLDLSQVQPLFLTLYKQKPLHIDQSPQQTKFLAVESLLVKKYALATLQELAKSIPTEIVPPDNGQLTAVTAARYLVPSESSDNGVLHSVLGTLNQYLIDNVERKHQQLISFCKQHLKCSNTKTLQSSVRAFVLEEGKSKVDCVQQYLDKYLNIWEELKRDAACLPPSLSKLDEECCKDDAVFSEYFKYIEQEGPLSGSYRELLACIYNVNIRLYVMDGEKNCCLHSNHNPSSDEIIYILFDGDKFQLMAVDSDYLTLDYERKIQDDIYVGILMKTKSFSKKKDFDDYLAELTLERDPFPVVLKPDSIESRGNVEEELAAMRKIIDYFPNDERVKLAECLEKVTYQYTGQKGIAASIFSRFSIEGRHVSSWEFHYILSSILNICNRGLDGCNTFTWLLCAQPQTNWVAEIVLMQIENYFNRRLPKKSKIRDYTSSVENKQLLILMKMKLYQVESGCITIESIEETLHLLSSVDSELATLAGLGLTEWPYALKEKYWTQKLLILVKWEEKDKFQTSLYYLLSLENICSTILVENFMDVLDIKKKELSPITILNILSNFHNQEWSLTADIINELSSSSFSDWLKHMDQQSSSDVERDVSQLVHIIQNNGNTSQGVLYNLQSIEQSIKTSNCKDYVSPIYNKKPVSEFDQKDFEHWTFKLNCSKNKESYRDIIAVVNQAIKLQRGFYLRDTQKLTVMLLLSNDSNTLAQVSTGEGKTLIVVVASIMKALCGEKVHIVTSSSVLAKRDADINQKIFSLFGINVSHNCHEDIEKRKQAYSSNQVIYGDLSNFQRDYLLDELYTKNILGDHNFVNMIVDEVDSMLLDQGNNMLYLSHNIAGLDHLESVYLYIWQRINMPVADKEELFQAFNIDLITEAVLRDLYGLIKPSDIKLLSSGMTEHDTNSLLERLIGGHLIDKHGKILKENIERAEVSEILGPKLSRHVDRLHFLLKGVAERDRLIRVANELKPFIEYHLKAWIRSAITAYFMREGQDYVVDVDRSGTSPDRCPIITIVDRETGTDRVNSQWDEALHQFLQLKHGCKLSTQSLKAVFISNVSFFKLYNHLYGLTGTLGSQRERSLLKELHHVDFVTVPTARRKHFYEEKPVLCSDQLDWIHCLIEMVQVKTRVDRRSVLIICETVSDVETLEKAFKENGVDNLHCYTRDYEEFDVAQGNRELEQEQVILSTNLAGRGTDIVISDGLRKAAGLHVCLTYLPKNIRIEEQAFGRAARNGDKGSGQIIIKEMLGKEYSNVRIFDLKTKRDAEELLRLSEVKYFYESQIIPEERCFKSFSRAYGKLNATVTRKLNDSGLIDLKLKHQKDKDELKEILLQSCLDRWAFWLDRNKKQITLKEGTQVGICSDDSLEKLIALFEALNFNCIDDLCPWVRGNLHQMVKLGKFLAKQNENDLAMIYFDEVIKQESIFSGIAHYYKAFSVAKKIDWEQSPLEGIGRSLSKSFKQELLDAVRYLEERSKFAIYYSGIVSKIKKKNKGSVIQTDAYEEQQKSIVDTYQMFSRSIDDILGHAITPQSFISADITEEIAINLFETFMREGVLKKAKIKKNISERVLKIISSDYGLSLRRVREFFSHCRGNQVDLKEFQDALKKKIGLASREDFWKCLTSQGVLGEEVSYVMVNEDKLRKVSQSTLDVIVKENKNNLKKVEPKNKSVFLNAELMMNNNDFQFIFKKDDFLKFIKKSDYKTLKKKGAISSNKEANFNCSDLKSVEFPYYDSITVGDLTNRAICAEDAKLILAELVRKEVLYKKSSSQIAGFGLNVSLKQIEEIDIDVSPVYEQTVKGLLAHHFCYRIALQEIDRQLNEKDLPVQLKLMTKPHLLLLSELLEHKILKPVTVAQHLLTENQIKQILQDIKITKEPSVKTVLGVLEQNRSSLMALEVPDFKLTPITEVMNEGDFGNLPVICVFNLNGLNEIIQTGEKRWTLRMILSAGAVLLIGICQTFIGVMIELFSVGALTHLGAAFMSEGVSDIIYAGSAFISGYFSWSDYGKHKLYSLLLTAGTCGIGALISKGVNFSRFGWKLIGNSKYFKQVEGVVKSAKEIAKDISIRITKNVVIHAGKKLSDFSIEMLTQKLCEEVGSSILSNIDQEVDQNTVYETLEEAYDILGEQAVKKMLEHLVASVLEEKELLEILSINIRELRSTIINRISAGLKEKPRGGDRFQSLNDVVDKSAPGTEYISGIHKVKLIYTNLLDNLDCRLKEELSSIKCVEDKRDTEQNFLSFKREIQDQLKALLRQKTEAVLKEQLIDPLIQDGVHCLVQSVGKKMKQGYQSNKGMGYYEQFDNLKRQYEQDLMDTSDNQASGKSELESHISEQYQKDLLELMKKTRNPELFAAIVRENIQMDFTCVAACSQVIFQVLRIRGADIPGLNVTIEGENGVGQSFSVGEDSEKKLSVILQLKDNHFQLQSSDSECRGKGSSSNNCLFDALVEAVPELQGMSAGDFRQLVANTIETNPQIQHHVRQGWHGLALSLGAYGGRRRSKLYPDESSEVTHDDTTLVHRHLSARVVRYVRLHGILQRISEKSGLKREEILKGGPSEYQDKSSTREGFHSAHMNRVGAIHPDLQTLDPEGFRELKDFLGHTQEVQIYANRWHGIGGDIDLIQSNSIGLCSKLDFSLGEINDQNREILNALKNQAVSSFKERLKVGRNGNKLETEGSKVGTKGKLSYHERRELKKAKRIISNFDVQNLFEKGRRGYLHKYKHGSEE